MRWHDFRPFEAAANGDVSWRDQHVSHDPNLHIVGTDPEEWLLGDEAYRFLKDEAESVGGKVTVEVKEVEAFREGNVGWGVALPIITIADGRRIAPRQMLMAVLSREISAKNVRF